MDVLDRIAPTAADLLSRVDDQLARTGAAPDHPLWTVLRRVGALPGDAVTALVALRPAPVAAAGRTLRELAPAYESARVALRRPAEWDGSAAEAYAGHVRALADGLTVAADGVAAASSDADAVADWLTDSRRRTAVELAAVLASTEAVSIVLGGADAPAAAATVAARVLGAVDAAIEAGAVLATRP
jgi:hypothetical protein